MRKTFEYRLYPNRRQRELLMARLIDSRHLYNEMLETVKDHYAESGELLFKYELMDRFKGRGGEHVPATTVQTFADRLEKSLAALRRPQETRAAGRTPTLQEPKSLALDHVAVVEQGRAIRGRAVRSVT
jgi:hypothetical protein